MSMLISPRAGAPALLVLGALLLGGCGQTPRAPAPPPPATAGTAVTPPPPRAEPRPAPPPVPASALETEQRWLSQWFDGTPVRISRESDGAALQLAVPLAFAFDATSATPKPALQAVLDKLGQSLKRQPASRLRIGAPGPAARALAARRHLLAQGVAAHRVEAASAVDGADVLLRLNLAPASGSTAHGRAKTS